MTNRKDRSLRFIHTIGAGDMAKRMVLFLCGIGLTFLPLPMIRSAEAAYVTHGPVVGAVQSNSAKMFVRASERAEVAFSYSLNPDLSDAHVTKVKTARRKNDFTVHISLHDLEENTTYYYDVIIDGVPQIVPPYPHFQTFPFIEQSMPFQFIALADARGCDEVPVYDAAGQEENARFVIQLGDFPHGNKDTLGGSRRQYKKTYRGTSFVNSISPQFPFFHTWDDHDYGKNNSDKRWYNKANSLQAFKEYFPANLANPNAGVWQKFRFAQAEFFLLDCRSQRDRSGRTDNARKSMLDGDNLAKHNQKRWLKKGLLNSTAKWKFVISPVPFNPTAKPDDAWGAYQTERGKLLSFIADNDIRNVIVLSGDLHTGGRLDDGTNSGDPSLGVWIPELNVPQSLTDESHSNEINCSGNGPCGQWSEGDLTATPGYGLVTVETVPSQVILEIKDLHGVSRQTLVVEDQEDF